MTAPHTQPSPENQSDSAERHRRSYFRTFKLFGGVLLAATAYFVGSDVLDSLNQSAPPTIPQPEAVTVNPDASAAPSHLDGETLALVVAGVSGLALVTAGAMGPNSNWQPPQGSPRYTIEHS